MSGDTEGLAVRVSAFDRVVDEQVFTLLQEMAMFIKLIKIVSCEILLDLVSVF